MDVMYVVGGWGISLDEARVLRVWGGLGRGWYGFMVEIERGGIFPFLFSLMRFIDISVLNLEGLDKGFVYGEGVIPSEYFI